MKCALCGQDNMLGLCNSHIIPKFVYDYLKETSFTKKIISANAPSLPSQDGTKYKILCNKCENNQSVYEDKFCRNIFRPYHQGKDINGLSYDEWLTKLISFTNWKLLYCNLTYSPHSLKKSLSKKQFELLQKTELRWRKYLLGQARRPKNPLNCVIFFDYISDYKGFDELPENLSRYLGRAIDGTIVYDTKGKELWVYSKLLKVGIVSIIKGKWLRDWRDAKVEFPKGKIKIPQKISSRIGCFIFNRVKEVFAKIDQRSEKQKQKVLAKQLSDLEGFAKTETARSLYEEHWLKELKEIKARKSL